MEGAANVLHHEGPGAVADAALLRGQQLVKVEHIMRRSWECAHRGGMGEALIFSRQGVLPAQQGACCRVFSKTWSD